MLKAVFRPLTTPTDETYMEQKFIDASDPIPEGTTRIKAYKLSKEEKNKNKKAAARKHKLQKGSYATYWTPNPSEIVTKDQYNKLVNAITSLGGSI